MFVSEESHPDNIVVFRAASASEAVKLADEALSIPQIQGAVWINKPKIFDKERDVEFAEKHGLWQVHPIEGEGVWRHTPVDPKDSYDGRRILLQRKGYKGPDQDQTKLLPYGEARDNFDFSRYVDPSREELIAALGDKFMHVNGTIWHYKKTPSNPHTLYVKGKNEDVGESQQLRHGIYRVIEAKNLSGHFVFAADDTKAEQPISVPVGAPIFMGRSDNKFLVSAHPAYYSQSQKHPLVVDIYDCFVPR